MFNQREIKSVTSTLNEKYMYFWLLYELFSVCFDSEHWYYDSAQLKDNSSLCTCRFIQLPQHAYEMFDWIGQPSRLIQFSDVTKLLSWPCILKVDRNSGWPLSCCPHAQSYHSLLCWNSRLFDCSVQYCDDAIVLPAPRSLNSTGLICCWENPFLVLAATFKEIQPLSLSLCHWQSQTQTLPVLVSNCMDGNRRAAFLHKDPLHWYDYFP